MCFLCLPDVQNDPSEIIRAAISGSSETVKLLIGKGVDLEATDKVLPVVVRVHVHIHTSTRLRHAILESMFIRSL